MRNIGEGRELIDHGQPEWRLNDPFGGFLHSLGDEIVDLLAEIGPRRDGKQSQAIAELRQ